MEETPVKLQVSQEPRSSYRRLEDRVPGTEELDLGRRLQAQKELRFQKGSG